MENETKANKICKNDIGKKKIIPDSKKLK